MKRHFLAGALALSALIATIPTAPAVSAAPAPVSIKVGIDPNDVALSPDGARAYVTQGFLSGSLVVIDTRTNTVVARVAVGEGPESIVVSPDGSRAYIAGPSTGTVTIVDTSTLGVLARITVCGFPSDLAVSPDGKRLYVACANDDAVAVVDTASRSVISRVAARGVYGVAVAPGGARAYAAVSSPRSAVKVIDAATNTVLSTIDLGSRGVGNTDIAVSPDGGRGYVTMNPPSPAPALLAVVDLTAGTVTSRVTIGRTAYALAITGDGSRVLVSTEGTQVRGPVGANGLISIVDTASATVLGTVSAADTRSRRGDGIAVAVHPNRASAYVALYGSKYLGVVDIASVPATPGLPRSVTAQGRPTTATVTWRAPAGAVGATYRVTLVGVVEGTRAPSRSCTTASLTCTVTGLEPELTYEVLVQAQNGEGWGPVAQGSPLGWPRR